MKGKPDHKPTLDPQPGHPPSDALTLPEHQRFTWLREPPLIINSFPVIPLPRNRHHIYRERACARAALIRLCPPRCEGCRACTHIGCDIGCGGVGSWARIGLSGVFYKTRETGFFTFENREPGHDSELQWLEANRLLRAKRKQHTVAVFIASISLTRPR